MSSLDSYGFLNKGVMCDTFKTSGKEPDSEDKLTMLVMGVSITSRQDFNNLVGNGSRSQDLSWEKRLISYPHLQWQARTMSLEK